LLIALWNRRTVTYGAGLRVLAPQRLRIEARAMGVEPPATYHRVAGKTIALSMAGDAALQILPRCLAMIQQEKLLGIVVARIQRPLSR
jgi:hypothetical protein